MKRLTLRKKQETRKPERITNDTVGEHRKRVLAGGRKFKYPIQYSRHKLVINTIIISVLALIATGVFGWWQLSPQQNTGTFAYRVTSVLPVSVANVGGETVRYSDYLLKLRSAEHYLERKEQTVLGDDNAEQRTYLKQQAMRDAIADAYALGIAREQGITVSDEELAIFLKDKRLIEGSEITERTQQAVIRDYYGWSPDEYAHVMRIKLLRQKVAYHIDGTAKSRADGVRDVVMKASQRVSWQDLIKARGAEWSDMQYGISGMVPRTNQDGGLAVAAAGLEEQAISGIVQVTADNEYYYAIIRLLDSNKTQVNYEFILVPAVEFQRRLNEQYDKGGVHVLIDVPLKKEGE